MLKTEGILPWSECGMPTGLHWYKPKWSRKDIFMLLQDMITNEVEEMDIGEARDLARLSQVVKSK